ncbi:cell division protein ZapA [Rhizobium sp. CFBP 13726]|jgi:cell division protein ZapA|uniref:cell division protein ZapA n=1 Tax=Rhizobium sp. CFBP 13726 TaxID=2775296 RepID=UPI000DE00B08|nr:cell division protein ZapA [Rhizobium sp. CFBP 13726]MBD8651565.1 cell division protein ZapA [Rhizobium sp. CFBP 13726]
MAQVTVTIDGKAYRMACEEGQEQHLTDLADQFDRYVGHLKGQFGEIGDLRITVMAGIMIMDELSELTRKVGALEGEVQSLKSNRAGAVENQSRSDELIVSALSELSSRLEGLTAKLNGRAPAN